MQENENKTIAHADLDYVAWLVNMKGSTNLTGNDLLKILQVVEPDLKSGDGPALVDVSNNLICQNCGEKGASRRRQNTSYGEDEKNFGVYCARCQAEVDAYWNDMWNEYYSGRI